MTGPAAGIAAPEAVAAPPPNAPRAPVASEGESRRVAIVRPGLEGLLVAAASVICAAWALKLWRADLTLPLRYSAVDDAKFYLMLVKGIIDHGAAASNPSLGAPFGQQLIDYPQGADNLNLLIIRGLALFSSSPALVVNLFYLLTFALAGVSSHFVLRGLGVTAAAAGVVSVLFSLLTYHFFRGESHLLLSAYYAVPLSAYLFLELLGARPLFAGRAPPGARGSAWASRRSLATIALCVVVGSDNLYYAAFALVLLVSATVIAALARRRRAAVHGLVVVALVTGTVAANLAPSLAYRAEHGTNAAVERSAAVDASTDEAFALSPMNLILPEPRNRIAPFREIAARYDHAVAPRYCESCFASLGAIGTVGFGWLAVCAFAAVLAGAGWVARRRLLRHASLGAGIALAAGAVGGVGSALEVFVTPDIRAWNRISIVIAFFSLLAVALMLDALLASLRRRRGGPALAVALLGAVLAFGTYDQTTDAFVPPYSAIARQWGSDRTFVAEIQARLPRGASVFQLPYVPFPEGYPQTRPGDQVATYATKYELLRGYLHSSTLRWSYGAMKGRPGDWAAQLASQPLSTALASVAAAGFDGVWLDPAGFEPTKATAVLGALRTLLMVTPVASPDRDLWFFDLRPYRARLEGTDSAAELALLRRRTLYPLRTSCAAAGLRLDNPGASPVAATLTAHLVPSGTLTRRLVLAPGGTVVTIARPVRDATLTDDALARVLAPPLGAADRRAGRVVAGLTGPPCRR